MPDIDPIYKVTILARGRTGGHAMAVPEDDKGLMTRSEMISRLVFAMGGRAAEELVFRDPPPGRPPTSTRPPRSPGRWSPSTA
jgi:cell division protease FtsH